MNIKINSISAALLVLSAPCALAVNYPTELRIDVTDSDVGPPLMFVGFNNNEGDRASFRIEASIDGVVLPRWPDNYNADLRCTKSADDMACSGINGTGRAGWSTTKGHRAVEIMRIKRDTDYCFRVKATSEQKDSAWTPWVCAHTPALPARPSVVPPRPQVTLLDPGSGGRGQVGTAVPGRVLVEWSQNAANVAWYAVERADLVKNAAWSEVGSVKPSGSWGGGDLEFVETIADLQRVPGPDKPANYRVCAANIGGKTCSLPMSYPPFNNKQTASLPHPLGRTPHSPPLTAQSGPSLARSLLAPEILTPSAGSRVALGQLQLKVSPSPGTEARQAEAEFTWQAPRSASPSDPTPASPPPVLWKVSMAELAKGAVVPAADGPTRTGVWVARVRSVRGTTPEPWSAPVSFTFDAPKFARTSTTAPRAGAAVLGTTMESKTMSNKATMPTAQRPPLQEPVSALDPGTKQKAALDWNQAAPGANPSQLQQRSRP